MKKRYLLIISIVAFAFGIGQIAFNQAQAQSKIRIIISKDELGQDVTAEISELEKFIESHMQTSATFTLKGSYNRAVAAAQATAGTNTTGEVYAKAQASCGRRTDSVTQAKCVSDYVARNSTPGINPQPVNMPSIGDFTKTFYGPNWALDPAGISILVGAAAIAGVVYIAVL